MTTQELVVALAVVSVTCTIAVLLARRWHTVSAWLATVGWSVACVGTYWFTISTWPPIPWTLTAADSEPWQSVVWPIMAIGCVWPILFEQLKRWPSVTLLTVLVVTCLPILAALCQIERMSAMFAGNTAWSLAALLSVGINWLAIERISNPPTQGALDDSTSRGGGAGRWSLWIIVGQSLTIAAIIMTCYGSFGEWATSTGITLAVVAVARTCVSERQANWSSVLALPALALNAVLMMHVREYRTAPLPVWLLPLPFLLPCMVASVDIAWSSRLHPALRVIAAAILTAALAATSIAIVLNFNGPAEEW